MTGKERADRVRETKTELANHKRSAEAIKLIKDTDAILKRMAEMENKT